LLVEEADILRRVRVGERIEHYETHRISRDGRILDVSITISPIRNVQGTIIGASKIMRDITEAKRSHAELRESERRLAREVAGARALHSISGADRIDVSLGCGVDQIELIVRDFGSGLDILAIKRSGLGLASIKERLKAVDGELFIRSQPRQGTTIHVCMPLAQGAGDST